MDPSQAYVWYPSPCRSVAVPHHPPVPRPQRQLRKNPSLFRQELGQTCGDQTKIRPDELVPQHFLAVRRGWTGRRNESSGAGRGVRPCSEALPQRDADGCRYSSGGLSGALQSLRLPGCLQSCINWGDSVPLGFDRDIVNSTPLQ